jgi:hypothetical protein
MHVDDIETRIWEVDEESSADGGKIVRVAFETWDMTTNKVRYLHGFEDTTSSWMLMLA